MDTVKIDVPKSISATLEFTPKAILVFDIFVIIGGFAGMISALSSNPLNMPMFVAQAGMVCQVLIRHLILYNMGINYKWERVSCLADCKVPSCSKKNESDQCILAKPCDGWKKP